MFVCTCLRYCGRPWDEGARAGDVLKKKNWKGGAKEEAKVMEGEISGKLQVTN